MKNLHLVCLLKGLLIVCSGGAQKIDMNGFVSIHNSKFNTGNIVYASDVAISADFSTPTSTDTKGSFHLTFVNVSSGTSVNVKAEKAGWEVVNKRELQDVVVGRLTPLKIYLARKGELAKAKSELLNVSLEALTKRHDELITELKQNNAQSRKVILDLEEKLNRTIADRFEAEQLLGKQLIATKKRLPKFAQELATVNLDFASKMYQEAYGYFKSGEIEKAIEILDEAILDRKAKEAIESFKELYSSLNDLDSARIKERQRLHKIIETNMLRANSYAKQKDYKSAINTYQNFLEKIADSLAYVHPIDKAAIYLSLSDLYDQSGHIKLAIDYGLRHLRIYENLQDRPLEEMVQSYQHISHLYEADRQFKSSIEYQKKALELLINNVPKLDPQIESARERLAHLFKTHGWELDQQHRKLAAADIYQQLSQFYLSWNHLEKSVFYQKRAYDTLNNIPAEPDTILKSKQTLIQLLNTYGQELEDQQQYKKAIGIYEQLLMIQGKNREVKKKIRQLKKKL